MKIRGKHTIKLIENIVKDTLAPPEDLTIAEWADKYRVLSRESAAEAGKWETERTPYMKAIFDCVTDTVTKSISSWKNRITFKYFRKIYALRSMSYPLCAANS